MGPQGRAVASSMDGTGALARAARPMLAQHRMEGSAAQGFPFAITGAGRPGLALRCPGGFAARGDLLAFCNGIEVGRLPLPPEVAPGASLALPVRRLPLVPLPAVIRLADRVGGADLAEPWSLVSADGAQALLGPTPVAVEDLRLDQGMLRGVLLDRVNGLLRPLLVARINEASSRMAMVEAPVALPEGGCACRFALPLGPADLSGEGLSVTLALLGQEAPLARFDWTRAGVDAPAPRLAALEGRIRQLEHHAAATEATLQAAMRRRLDIQQERIDAFIEAAATLLLDRLAPAAATTALRDLIGATSGAAAPDVTGLPSALHDRTGIPLGSAHFGFGWHDAEQDQAGPFRWMAGQGVVTNPAPHRPVAGVELAISHVYGARTPVLRAAFDGQPCEVAVRGAGQGQEPGGGPGGFVASILPAEPRTCLALHLESPHASSPAGDGASGDGRILSVAVAEIVFTYAE